MSRDCLHAIRDRVVVYGAGIGATLDQFERALGGLPGKCHERSCSITLT
jgi:hypothetical protein